ncbi:MAG: biotin/lipoyl-containing protein [bacterium]
MAKDNKKVRLSKKKTESNDIERVLDAYQFMRREGLNHLEVQESDSKLIIKRCKENGNDPSPSAPEQKTIAAHPKPATDEKKESLVPSIKSPLMGTLYRSSSPSADPFVREGETVEAGAILCIVEAMKVMNEIRAEKSCRIKKILVENGKPVTASQPLFEVEFL